MRWTTYPREISPELFDPLLDTYHVDGADIPETMEGRRVRLAYFTQLARTAKPSPPRG